MPVTEIPTCSSRSGDDLHREIFQNLIGTVSMYVFVLLAVVFVGVVATAIRPHHLISSSPNATNGRYVDTAYAHHSQYGTSARLNYSTQISAHCVALDQLTTLEQVTCSDDAVVLRFNTSTCNASSDRAVMTVCSAADAVSRWTNRTLLNGGTQWECTDHRTSMPVTIIMRRVVGIQVINSTALKILTAPASVTGLL